MLQRAHAEARRGQKQLICDVINAPDVKIEETGDINRRVRGSTKAITEVIAATFKAPGKNKPVYKPLIVPLGTGLPWVWIGTWHK